MGSGFMALLMDGGKVEKDAPGTIVSSEMKEERI